MVQVKYGSIIDEMKGKQGGSVFKGGYSAPSMQSIGKRSKSYTSWDQYPLGKLAYIAQLWRSITEAQRTDWNTLALTWPFINCFGETYYGSGFQVFMSVNLNLSLVGTAWHNTAADRVADFVFTAVTGTWTAVNNTSEISFDNIETLGNWRIYLQASYPYSVGQYHKSASVHYLNEVYNTGGLGYWLWEVSYNARFNTTAHLLTWKKIDIRIKVVNTVSGQFVKADPLFLNSPV
jgi:hypothetical protein